MDGENNGKPYEQMDDLLVPLFLEAPSFWIQGDASQLFKSLVMNFQP